MKNYETYKKAETCPITRRKINRNRPGNVRDNGISRPSS